MKKLIVSVKPLKTSFKELSHRLIAAEKKNWKVKPHYEVSFTEMKDFKRFISNIDILKSIQKQKPKSIYELALFMKKDVGNLNKLINFFESMGAIELKEKKVNGRMVKEPYVPYQKIEFDLAS